MATQHRAGPWSYGPHGTSRFAVRVDDRNIAFTPTGEEEALAEANARVMAASPDLLEALKTSALIVHTTAHPGNTARFADCIDVVCVANRAAISKAEGR